MPAVVRFGPFEADLRSGELRKAGLRVPLQEQPFRLLALLVARAGEVVTREELRHELWPADTFVDFDHSLTAAVKRVRDALGDSAETPRFIETLPRRGYRFVAPVHIPTVAPPRPARRGRLWWFFVPTGALLVAALVTTGIRRYETRRPSISSIAVLPLSNLSGDSSQEWLADGMTEALSSTLSQIGALTVVSSTSTRRYKNTTKSAAEIARELGGVDALLEGALVRSDYRVRVTVALVHVPSDRRLWTATYEREAVDTLTLYSDVALAAVREMSVALTPDEKARLTTRRAVKPDAYEAYLRGSYLMTRWHEGGCVEAKRYFERAIDLDPGFAPPRSSLAYCTCVALGTHQTASDIAGARAAVARALASGDEPLALVASAFVKMRFDYDWPEAERDYRHAINVDPGSAAALMYYAEYLDVMRRDDEALAAMRQALRLNPFWMDHNVAFGYLLMRLGRYGEAIEQLRRTLEVDRNYQSGWLMLAFAHEYAGAQDLAVKDYLEYLDRVLVPGRAASARSDLERTYVRAGWVEFWRHELALAEEEVRYPATVWRSAFVRHCNAYWMARRYARLGEWDRTLSLLEQSYDERLPWTVFVQRERLFDPLRANHRFQHLIRRMRLTPHEN